MTLNASSLAVLTGLAALAPFAMAASADVTRDDIVAIPERELRDSLYVVRGKALLVNLEQARTPADWRRVPGIKGAWKKSPGLRGKTVLEDVDGDGILELYGESPGKEPGRSSFWCREADGRLRWETEIRTTSGDNNGVHCEDLDGDGVREVVVLGNYLQVLDARNGRLKWERFVFADVHGGPAAKLKGDEYRFEYPYRLGHCTDRTKLNIVTADGLPATGDWSRKMKDGKRPGFPEGGGQIIAYTPEGKVAWHFKHVGKTYIGGAHEIRVHDLDGDGLDEVLYAANGGTICLNPDGTQRWRFDAPAPATHSDWIGIDDVTGDGQLDVVVQHGGPLGFVYILHAASGKIQHRTKVEPYSEVQNLAVGKFRPDLPGRQIALSTINGCMLRLIDGSTGAYLDWQANAAEWPTLLRWNNLDMYNCIAHDANGDGVDEIFTFNTPKRGQLTRVGKDEVTKDPRQAMNVGVAAFKGDGTHLQYWNFYTPTAKGIQWGASQWDMRQFHAPVRKFDIDRNGVEEAYIETKAWIVLAEIVDLRKLPGSTAGRPN